MFTLIFFSEEEWDALRNQLTDPHPQLGEYRGR